jgi:hypothetical protein
VLELDVCATFPSLMACILLNCCLLSSDAVWCCSRMLTFRRTWLPLSSGFSKTLVSYHVITRRYNPRDKDLNLHCRESLATCIISFSWYFFSLVQKFLGDSFCPCSLVRITSGLLVLKDVCVSIPMKYYMVVLQDGLW